jgi:hypothetical protein
MALKHAISVLITLSLIIQSNAQGTDCSSPIPLTLNGLINNYLTSASTGSEVVCTGYTTLSPVTWFSFTTGTVAECPLLNITASDHGNCEIAFYTACGGNISNNLVVASSMCFDDGEGLWAPAETFSIQTNHTYYLRVKTSSPCTISIGGQTYVPSNNNCSGAKSITTSSFTDNNSCNRPSTEVTPGQLCAFTLENTAFYKFYVASAGSAIINISSISCDNGDANNSNGFQIGFFTGSCGGLVPINCTNGSGTFVQATTNPLPAGSLVYVAIDGVSGSNCQYALAGINVWGALSTNFKDFSGWQTYSANELNWMCSNDSSAFYVIERSADGSNFSTIGQVDHPNRLAPAIKYTFVDSHPFKTSFYRVKQVDQLGNISMSHIITVVRKEGEHIKITMQNTVFGSLHLQIECDSKEQLQYAIANISGQSFLFGSINCYGGKTDLFKDISFLPPGRYILLLKSSKQQTIKSFIKLN